MRTLVYASDNNGWEQVLFSALSFSYNSKEALDIHVLSMPFLDVGFSHRAFSRANATFIDKAIKKVNPLSSFTLHRVDEVYSNVFESQKREWRGRSPYTILKYLLPRVLKDKEEVLWLDYDVVALKDITPLFELDKSKPFNAGYLRFSQHSSKKHPFFDTGAIYLNLKVIKDNKLDEMAIEYLKRKPFYSDIASFSTLFGLQVTPFTNNLLAEKLPTEASVLKHFRKKTKYKTFQFKKVKMLDEEMVLNNLNIKALEPIYNLYKEATSNRIKNEAKKKEDDNKRYIVQIKHLYKTYGSLKAVDDVSFNVERGSLFAFLGLNGAGKSTTINIISSILNKDYGSVIIDGYDLDKERNAIKKEIGIVFQSSTLDDILTSYENLALRASFYGMSKKEKEERIKEITTLLHLEPILDRPVGKLSGGQRRRLDIARSMVHAPRLLILDEPTTGLDPKTRQDVWRLIDDIREKTGMTVFLTTHYLEEAEKATSVVIMDHGRIIAQGTPNELKNKYSKDYVIAYSDKTPELDDLAKKVKGSFDADKPAYLFPVKDSLEAREFINAHKDIITDFEIKKGNMDDVFLNVTGLKFEEGKEND